MSSADLILAVVSVLSATGGLIAGYRIGAERRQRALTPYLLVATHVFRELRQVPVEHSVFFEGTRTGEDSYSMESHRLPYSEREMT